MPMLYPATTCASIDRFVARCSRVKADPETG